MKQIKAILLLIILIVPFWGFYLFIKSEIKQTRKQVKRMIIAGMEKNDLCLLSFSKEEQKQLLKWKHSREFQFEYFMYDIVYSDSSADSVYYWCWKDVRETELNVNLDTLLFLSLQKQNPQQKKSNKVIEFYKNLFCSAIGHPHLFKPKSSILAFNFIESFWLSVYIIPSEPPPKV